MVAKSPQSAELVDVLAVVLLPPVGGQVSPAVWSAAVGVGDAVGVSQLAGAGDLGWPPLSVNLPGQRGSAAVGVGRRFRDREPGRRDASVAPVLLGRSEFIQH